MKFTRWSVRPGGKTHLKKPSAWRYLCGLRASEGHQGVLLKIGVCRTCAKMQKLIEKRGY